MIISEQAIIRPPAEYIVVIEIGKRQLYGTASSEPFMVYPTSRDKFTVKPQTGPHIQEERCPVKRYLLTLFLAAICLYVAACSARGSCLRGNCRNGLGLMAYPEGAKYEGQWRDSKRSGQGVLTNPYAGRYEGQWKNDKPHGLGTWIFPDGARYEGQWKNGEWHGQGTMTFPDGRRYVGTWKNDVPHGLGRMIYPDGRELIGEFNNGTFVGN